MHTIESPSHPIGSPLTALRLHRRPAPQSITAKVRMLTIPTRSSTLLKLLQAALQTLLLTMHSRRTCSFWWTAILQTEHPSIPLMNPFRAISSPFTTAKRFTPLQRRTMRFSSTISALKASSLQAGSRMKHAPFPQTFRTLPKALMFMQSTFPIPISGFATIATGSSDSAAWPSFPQSTAEITLKQALSLTARGFLFPITAPVTVCAVRAACSAGALPMMRLLWAVIMLSTALPTAQGSTSPPIG